MPRKVALPPREVEICRRLETYRREAKIPRSVFARAVGLIPESLATYERALAPIRWDTFTSIYRHFPIHPTWLVTGHGEQRLLGSPDFDHYVGRLDKRTLLSDAYDSILGEYLQAFELRESLFGVGGVSEKLDAMMRFTRDLNPRPTAAIPVLCEMAAQLDQYSFLLSEALKDDGSFAAMKMLTTYGTADTMKSLLGPKRRVRGLKRA